MTMFEVKGVGRMEQSKEVGLVQLYLECSLPAGERQVYFQKVKGREQRT